MAYAYIHVFGMMKNISLATSHGLKRFFRSLLKLPSYSNGNLYFCFFDAYE